MWEEAGAFFWVSLFYLFISDIVGGFLCFDGEFEFFWKIHMEMERKKVRNEREETTRVGNYRSDPTQ